MAQTGNLFLNLGSLTPVGMSDLNSDDATPKGFTPGAVAIMTDAFGFKAYKYGLAPAAATQGAFHKKVANVTGTITANAGEVNDLTHYAVTGNWASANLDRGKIAYVTGGTAGAAPEGDTSIVAAHGTGQVTIDSRMPLSAPLVVGNTIAHISVFHTGASASGDNAIICYGVVMAARTAGNYGWYCMYGPTIATFKATTAVAALAAVIAETSCLTTFGASTVEDWVGFNMAARGASTATTRGLAFIDLWRMAQPQ